MTQKRAVFQNLLFLSGRAARGEMLLMAAVLFILQFAFWAAEFMLSSVPDVFHYMLAGVFGWIGFVATARRLHDIGYSAWWVPAGLACLCMWSVAVAFLAVMIFGTEAFRPDQATYVIILGILFLPVLGIALWLHLAVSDPLPNRYGPPQADEQFTTADASNPASAVQQN